VPKPPRDLSYFDKVNYVIDAWADPCEAPWYIYVESLKPALLSAFITLTTFGWDDIARGYWRPKGQGRRSGKKRGKGKPKARRGFPELGELLGENLPGADEIKGRSWSHEGRWMWAVDTAAQRLLFRWMVADVTIDFAYEFTSVLYETGWCRNAHKGRFSWSDTAWKPVQGGAWHEIAIFDKDYEQRPPAWHIDSGFVGNGPATVAYAVSLRERPPFAKPSSFQTRMVDDDTNEVLAQTGELQTRPDGSIEVPVLARLPANMSFNLQILHDGAWAEYGQSVVTCQET